MVGQSFLIFRFTVPPTNDFLVSEKKSEIWTNFLLLFNVAERDLDIIKKKEIIHTIR